MCLLLLAAEIHKKIMSGQQFKKYMSDNKTILNLEFYECDMPSVTYRFDKNTFYKLLKLLMEDR